MLLRVWPGAVRGAYPKEVVKAWMKSSCTEPDGNLMARGFKMKTNKFSHDNSMNSWGVHTWNGERRLSSWLG